MKRRPTVPPVRTAPRRPRRGSGWVDPTYPKPARHSPFAQWPPTGRTAENSRKPLRCSGDQCAGLGSCLRGSLTSPQRPIRLGMALPTPRTESRSRPPVRRELRRRFRFSAMPAPGFSRGKLATRPGLRWPSTTVACSESGRWRCREPGGEWQRCEHWAIDVVMERRRGRAAHTPPTGGPARSRAV